MTTKKIEYGYYGLYVELDTDEVFEDDPGRGTPALVYKNGYEANATYWCARETGELEGGIGLTSDFYRLTDAEIDWLWSIDDEIHEFLYSDAA